MIDDATLAEWEDGTSKGWITESGKCNAIHLRQAITEIRRLRECRTCGGAPHPSGKVCICGGTNFVEEELRQIRLALFAAERGLTAHRAVVRELAECLEDALATFDVWVSNSEQAAGRPPATAQGESTDRMRTVLTHPLVQQAREEKG